MDIDDDQIWNGVAGMAAMGAGLAAKPLAEAVWRRLFGGDLDADPASRDVRWRDALLWAVFTGATVGVVRLVAQRGAAAAWARTRGDYPAALSGRR